MFLHNDDVHTYDEVSSAIASAGLPDAVAQTLTEAVDHEGQTCVFKTSMANASEFDQFSEKMEIFASSYGLAVSVAPTRLFDLEQRVGALLDWMLSLARAHEGLQRIVTQAFVVPLAQLPETTCLEGTGFVSSAALFAPPADESFLPEFPSVVQHLAQASLEFDEAAWECFLGEPKEEHEGFVEPWRMLCPLLHSHGLRIPLAVLILSSPMLFKSIRQRISAMVIVYQQDAIFKVGYCSPSLVKLPIFW